MASHTNIDLHPERRRKAENETSQYFEHSMARGSQDQAETEATSPRGRQTVLKFDESGRLSTKVPLRNPIPRNDPERKTLSAIAKNTINLLPGLLATRPDLTTDGYLCEKDRVGHLDPRFCPGLPPVTVCVIDNDTIDAALGLSQSRTNKPVCILNMANAETAGGGFIHGAKAQEEALCYRSSLYFTLKTRHYPIPAKAVIYSPHVIVIRGSMKAGHELLDLRTPANLPTVSVVSAAAICKPTLSRSKDSYASQADKSLMEEKMRVILRTAIRNRHRQVVLAAFGCGVFANPNKQVAEMWLSVLNEQEFSGGWWEDVVFAILDSGKGSGNFSVFHKALHGKVLPGKR